MSNFLVELYTFTIAYVDPYIAGKRLGEINSQLFSWHCLGDDESILLIVTSIIDATILSIMNESIAGLPHFRWTIQENPQCRKVPIGDRDLYSCNIARIFNNNNAAKWLMVIRKVCNPTLFCIIYGGQQADGTVCGQTPMHGGSDYLA